MKTKEANGVFIGLQDKLLAIPNKIDPHLCNPENHVETTERQICFVKEKMMNGMTKVDSFCYPWMSRVTEAYFSG